LTSPSKVLYSKKDWQVSWLTAVVGIAFPIPFAEISGEPMQVPNTVAGQLPDSAERFHIL
jgi:hypothetical protein